MQKVVADPVVLISGYDKEMMPVTALAEKAFSLSRNLLMKVISSAPLI